MDSTTPQGNADKNLDPAAFKRLQQTQVQTLRDTSVLSGLLNDQPKLSTLVLQHMVELITTCAGPLDVSKIYAARVHASAQAVASLDTNNRDQRQAPLPDWAYSRSLGELVHDCLETGMPPCDHEGNRWKTFSLSLYEDTGVPGKVSQLDLLKELPVNHSDFELHAFRPVQPVALETFIDQMNNLLPTLRARRTTYWAETVAGETRQQAWARQERLRLAVLAQLLMLDGTLGRASHELLQAALASPQPEKPTARTFRLGLVAGIGEAPLTLHQHVLVAPSASSLASLEEASGPLIYCAPGLGLETYANGPELCASLRKRVTGPLDDSSLLNGLTQDDYLQLTEAQLHGASFRVTGSRFDTDPFQNGVSDRLRQRDLDLEFAFGTARQGALQPGLALFLQQVDAAASLAAPSEYWLVQRHQRLIEGMSDDELFEAWAAVRTGASVEGKIAPLVFFDLPPLSTNALTDGERRALLIDALATPNTQKHVTDILNRTPHDFPAPTLNMAFAVIDKIYRHQLKRQNITWTRPESDRYKAFVLEHELATTLGRAAAKTAAALITPTLLGLLPDQREAFDHHCNASQLDEAQQLARRLAPNLHTLIGASTKAPDAGALCRYLNVALVYPSDALNYALFLELLCDLPGFHRLERALVEHSRQPANTYAPAFLKALTLSAITDYLYPPTTFRPGCICGFNLNTVQSGASPFADVRAALLVHLKTTFGNPPDRGREALVFGSLAARYAPELLVRDIPAELDYGQSLNAVLFRQAVALAESVQPGVSLRRNFTELLEFFTQGMAEQLSDEQQIAIAISGQIPALHFAMCRGVITETPIAEVSNPDTLKALDYHVAQQLLEAETFRQLTLTPPMRCEMALARLGPMPEVDLHRKVRFTENQVSGYFVKGYLSFGRSMLMSPFDRYVTCGTDRSFDQQDIGFTPRLPGGCHLQKAFDAAYQTFKVDYLNGLVSRLSLALHDLPAVDRERILEAYKFIKLTFSDNGQKHTALYGVIALYINGDEEHAYEIFCPSGTIRRLEKTGSHNVRVRASYAPQTADLIHSASPYLNCVPLLDADAYLRGKPGQSRQVPELDVCFYTVARQIRDLDREGKIRFLCQKMVDELFAQPVDLMYDSFREPTPYEQYRENISAKTQQLASMVLPGYSLYLDISRGKVTVGTVLLGALEVLSLLVPFGRAAIQAFRAYWQLGKLLIRYPLVSVAKHSATAARVAYGARAFTVVLTKDLVQAGNPLGAIVFLFQGGVQGAAMLRAGLQFVRRQLSAPAVLSSLSKIRPPLPDLYGLSAASGKNLANTPASNALTSLRANPSTTRTALTIPQQLGWHARGINLRILSPAGHLYLKDGRTFIQMQGNAYEVKKLTSDTHWHLYNSQQRGPAVTYNTTEKRWEIAC